MLVLERINDVVIDFLYIRKQWVKCSWSYDSTVPGPSGIDLQYHLFEICWSNHCAFCFI